MEVLYVFCVKIPDIANRNYMADIDDIVHQ